MSKRGLSARLYAPNQTLIMVNTRLPTGQVAANVGELSGTWPPGAQQNRPSAFANGRSYCRQALRGVTPEAEGRKSGLGLTILGRRGRTLPMLRHELVELFLVLGVTQAIEEIAEFGLLFLEPPQGFHAVVVKGAVAAGGRTERKAAALHAIAHPLHLVLHPLHLVRPTIAMTPTRTFYAPACR